MGDCVHILPGMLHGRMEPVRGFVKLDAHWDGHYNYRDFAERGGRPWHWGINITTWF